MRSSCSIGREEERTTKATARESINILECCSVCGLSTQEWSRGVINLERDSGVGVRSNRGGAIGASQSNVEAGIDIIVQIVSTIGLGFDFHKTSIVVLDGDKVGRLEERQSLSDVIKGADLFKGRQWTADREA